MTSSQIEKYFARWKLEGPREEYGREIGEREKNCRAVRHSGSDVGSAKLQAFASKSIFVFFKFNVRTRVLFRPDKCRGNWLGGSDEIKFPFAAIELVVVTAPRQMVNISPVISCGNRRSRGRKMNGEPRTVTEWLQIDETRQSEWSLMEWEGGRWTWSLSMMSN